MRGWPKTTSARRQCPELVIGSHLKFQSARRTRCSTPTSPCSPTKTPVWRRSVRCPTLSPLSSKVISTSSIQPSRKFCRRVSPRCSLTISHISRFPNPHGHLPVFSAPIKGDLHEIQNFTSRAVPSSCARTITPACLQALYNIPSTAATQPSNKLAVTGFIEQFANQADLRVRSSPLPVSHCSPCPTDIPHSFPYRHAGFDDVHSPDPGRRPEPSKRFSGRCRSCKSIQ